MSKENSTETRLDRAVKGAQIFAFVVGPLIVAGIPWRAQATAAEIGASKDLVQASLQVLREPRHEADAAIRQWAVDTINRNSPVRMQSDAADQLSTSALRMFDSHPLLMPALQKRPPCPQINLKAIAEDQAPAVAALEELCRRNGKDLFWMQTFIGLVRQPKDSTPSTAK